MIIDILAQLIGIPRFAAHKHSSCAEAVCACVGERVLRSPINNVNCLCLRIAPATHRGAIKYCLQF